MEKQEKEKNWEKKTVATRVCFQSNYYRLCLPVAYESFLKWLNPNAAVGDANDFDKRVRQPCVHFDWFLCHYYTLNLRETPKNINIEQRQFIIFSFRRRIQRKLNKIYPFEIFGFFLLWRLYRLFLKPIAVHS